MNQQPPDPHVLAALGAAAQRAYAENPTDLNTILNAVDGASKLLTFVADDLRQLDSDKVPRKTIELLNHGIVAMVQARSQLVWTYVMSGEATDDMLTSIRESFDGGDPR